MGVALLSCECVLVLDVAFGAIAITKRNNRYDSILDTTSKLFSVCVKNTEILGDGGQNTFDSFDMSKVRYCSYIETFDTMSKTTVYCTRTAAQQTQMRRI